MKRRSTGFLKERASELRRDPSATERRLWERIRKKQLDGFRFRRRPIVLGKIPDFGCPEAALVIEIDGEATATKTPRDKSRDALFARHGIRTLHISSELIWSDMDQVVSSIRACLQNPHSVTGPERADPVT